MIDAGVGRKPGHQARRRTWLGDAQPAGTDYDDWITYVRWGQDVDTAIEHLRAQDPSVDALFRIAESDGLGITPVWPQENGEPHQLAELETVIDNTDWIMVSAKTLWRSSFTAEMIVDPLAPTSYSRHETTVWTIYITAH